jgi:hypothetical protein
MNPCPADPTQKKGRIGGLMAVAAAAVLLLGPAGGWCAPPNLQLEVAACESGRVLLGFETCPGDVFSIWFWHSYDRAPVEEHYRVLRDGRLLLTHLTLKSSLNGQGFVGGTYRSRRDGSAELADINQELEQVVFRLGSPDLADHALIRHGRRMRLLDHAEPGALLCIRARPR